jgi:2,3,4,5-tetrahydropyridine-2-carboxylate N-succinyltransferase
MTDIPALIESTYNFSIEERDFSIPPATCKAIEQVIESLDKGEIRVAEYKDGQWQVHDWIKKAVLLYFKTSPYRTFEAGYASFYDKIPLKYVDEYDFKKAGVRVVPSAIVRKGAYIAPNTVLMPSFVNIGAYIDSETMIDTWATVGSCAQIGKRVHLSGGAGIGGVLEPLQALPTIIEDDCFIGTRAEIVEGVVVEKGSVIGMGVFIGQSTPIYDRATKTILHGLIPSGSVVISGSLPSPDGCYNKYCAIIIKRVDEKTRSKTSINELLRDG